MANQFKKLLPSFLKLSKPHQQLCSVFRTLSTGRRNLTQNYERIFKKVLQPSLKLVKCYPQFSCTYRSLSTSKNLANNYEGDGKTTVTIINREYKHLIMIDSYSSIGFRLNNGIYAMGPLAVFPRTILQWNVNSIEEMTPESFSLFGLLDPKLDILVIGTGDHKCMPGKDILKYLKDNAISAEILPTDKAVALFNFLNAEGRCVAGAFIPPASVVVYGDELKLLEYTEDAVKLVEVLRPEKIVEK